MLDTVQVARRYNAEHNKRGGAKLSNLMNQYLHEVKYYPWDILKYLAWCFSQLQGAGDEQSHEALQDAEDLLAVAQAMARKKGITFKELLDMSPKKKWSAGVRM